MLNKNRGHMLKWSAAIIFTLSMVGCGERNAMNVPNDDGSASSDAGQADGYLFTYCEDAVVHTGHCTGGICDPVPFETCDDGSCVLSPDTCQAPPTSIAVTIHNELSKTIYIEGLFVPFSLRDSANNNIETTGMMNVGSCDQCNDVCDNNIPHGDPSPCYVEIAAGAQVTLNWNLMSYKSGSCTPACDKICSESSRIEPGDYTAVVPYRLDLEHEGYNFTQLQCSSIQGAPSWWGDNFGTGVFDQQAEVTVTYSAQDKLLLTIK